MSNLKFKANDKVRVIYLDKQDYEFFRENDFTIKVGEVGTVLEDDIVPFVDFGNGRVYALSEFQIEKA